MIDRRLGRGLESLISRTGVHSDAQAHEIAVDAIVPNPRQPRQAINEASLEGLAASIKTHGVLQPIVVRRHGNGFEVIAGERRWRASRLAGRATIPAVIMEAVDTQSLEMALIENIQREDLNPLEEAEAFNEVLSATSITQQELANRLGKSRASITNSLRLIDLPDPVKQLLRSGELSLGQAKAILAASSAEEMALLAADAVRNGWSVRELERRLHAKNAHPRTLKGKAGRTTTKKLANYQEQLRIIYGTKVLIDGSAERGRIGFDYYSAADLNRLLHVLLAAGLTFDEATTKADRGPQLADDEA